MIGAGPVGLTAAAHLVRRGMPFTVLESGDRVGASMRQWGHVRLFSPWALDIDPDAAALLHEQGWQQPNPADHPTGAELVERYLEPLAAHPAITPHLHLGATVTAITRRGRSRLDSNDRADTAFIVRYVQDGDDHELSATAVIDASGTWTSPNPLGAAGIPALGEAAAADHITYGIPDVTGTDRQRFAGKRIAVAGGGHSAANVLLDLAQLAADEPGDHHHLAAAPTRRRPTRGRRRQRRTARTRPPRHVRRSPRRPKASSASSATSGPTA